MDPGCSKDISHPFRIAQVTCDVVPERNAASGYAYEGSLMSGLMLQGEPRKGEALGFRIWFEDG